MTQILKVTPQGSIHYAGKAINKTPVNKDSIEAMTPEKDKMVRGMFKNNETPGQPGTVNMRLYKGQQPFREVMEDGGMYTIPLSVARAINLMIRYEKDKHMLDEKGNSIKTRDVPVQRYSFVSMDFQA
jgi:hypothetical protein